jgi:hypothetical protein
MNKDLIKDAITSWFSSRTHQYFLDVFDDGETCVIDGTFDLDALAAHIAAACPISDVEEEKP